ncbi:MAG TPA: hypothetical protein VJ728_12080 [Candidatus Binataceae bacterium]|nr:hypothetical protein [Candidatus Binataceae bacterium]
MMSLYFAILNSYVTTFLAEAQERNGAIEEALATVEQALEANPDEVFYRPETLGCAVEFALDWDTMN